MVNDQFRRGADTPRRTRRAHYTRRRRHRLGATSTGTGFKSLSPQFMRHVKNRPALRRRSHVHAIIRSFAVVGGIAALAYGGYYGYQRALTSPALSIQSVRLHQVPTMLIEPVRARLKPAYGQNLLALDIVALRDSIEELAAVRRAGVRRVLPDGIIVSVEAREPKARAIGEMASYVIDADGVVLDHVDRRRSRLPEIHLADGGEMHATPGQRLSADPTHGTSIVSALAVIDWLHQFDGEFRKPVDHLRVDGSGIVLVVTPARLEIIVGDETGLDDKMTAVRSLLYGNPPAGPTTIDARYADMLVVRALEPETG